jgi:prepilin-type N-terminal cleavage/methylation domain-containing protein
MVSREFPAPLKKGVRPLRAGEIHCGFGDSRGSDPFFQRGRSRRGLTLLEVLVALGIFLMAFATISQLISLSADRALEVQQLARASQLCQTKLAEVAAGIVPLSGQTGVPFDEDPKFLWSLDASQGDVAGLWKVTVKVTLERSDGSRVETSLDRMLLDPSLRGSAMDVALAATNSSSSSSSSGSSATGSSSGSSTTGSSGATGSSTPAAASPSSSSSAPKTITPSSSAPSSSGNRAGATSKGGS